MSDDPLQDHDDGFADPVASGVAVLLLWLFALVMLAIAPLVTRAQPAGRGWYLAPVNRPVLTLGVALAAGGLLLWRWGRLGRATGWRTFRRRAMSAFVGMGATLGYALAFVIYIQVIGRAGFAIATVLFVGFLFRASGLGPARTGLGPARTGPVAGAGRGLSRPHRHLVSVGTLAALVARSGDPRCRGVLVMEALLAGLEQILTWQVLLALMLGAITGILVGAVPGLEPAGAMAILLPFSLQMEPLSGITLLLGAYGGAWYGGAIPAILIRVPGTPVNVLTTCDGHPMAQRGEAMRALSLAYSASFVGGVISIAALILLAPYLAGIAPRFGAPDYAMVMLLATVSVVLAHQRQLAAAVMLLALGMFLGNVGLESPFKPSAIPSGRSGFMAASR